MSLFQEIIHEYMRVLFKLLICIVIVIAILITAFFLANIEVFGEESNVVVETIAFESSGESFEAQVMVAQVIITRAKEWGMTLEEVVKQKGQFSCWNSDIFPKLKKRTARELYNASKSLTIALQSTNSLPPVTFYYSGKKVPYWANSVRFVKQIGNLKFYYKKRKV